MSDALELVGLALITAAAWLVEPRLGLLVAGVAFVLVGLAIDRSKNK